MKKLSKWIIKEETVIDNELFKKRFNFQRPSDMFKELYITNDKEKNSALVNVINSGLNDLKEVFKKCMKKKEKLRNQIRL